jgi:hypothetical protein
VKSSRSERSGTVGEEGCKDGGGLHFWGFGSVRFGSVGSTIYVPEGLNCEPKMILAAEQYRNAMSCSFRTMLFFF